MSEEILEILVNFANAQEAAAVDLKHRIAKLVGVKESVAVKEETFDILKFETQKGEKLGEYEVAHRASNLPEKFSHAFGILKASNSMINSRYHGPNYSHGYWIYGADKIYRKRFKRGASEGTSKIDQVKLKFPKDLEDMLLFEEKEEYIVIRPRQYLGSDNFAKIAAIVRDQDGEYVSAGKESHFRVQRKK